MTLLLKAHRPRTSMWPRLMSRGRPWFTIRRRTGAMNFNVATTDESWKTRSTEINPSPTPNFNVATTDESWKTKSP